MILVWYWYDIDTSIDNDMSMRDIDKFNLMFIS